MIKNLLRQLIPSRQGVSPGGGDTAKADSLIEEGNREEKAQRLQLAEELYQQAVAIAPGHAKAHLNLGVLLAEKGDVAGATRAYEAVLSIDPEHAFGNYNFARLVYLSGNPKQAETLLRAALRKKPDFAQAAALLSHTLEALKDSAGAVEAMELALRLEPENFSSGLSLAIMLSDLKRNEEAQRAARRALALEPRSPEALRLLGLVLCAQGFALEALEPLREFIQIDPTRFETQSFELGLLNFDEALSAQEIFDKHRQFGARLEQAFPARFESYLGNSDKERRLRVGYVSADFCTHPVMLFLIPVLERHNRAHFEIFCYSTTANSDRITERVRGLCDQWVDVTDLSHPQLADRIHADAIDVLIDLTGHTRLYRLPVFSQQPAPIQATWVGYLNTTGLTRMDYRLCDVRTDPPEISQPLHTETLIPLPNSQWCYRPFIDKEVAVESPVEKNGYITFGSFNSALKITSVMCRRWGELLSRVPNSRLLLVDINSEQKRESIRFELFDMGISDDRFEFLPRVDLTVYYDLFSFIDISLDSFPYGGGTTTFDSLWMGVPVVAAMGSTPVSRSAASILSALGLDAWIAPSIDRYVEVAAALAADHQTVVELRRTLRQTLKHSPLTDEATFVRDLEAAYRQMWVTGRQAKPVS